MNVKVNGNEILKNGMPYCKLNEKCSMVNSMKLAAKLVTLDLCLFQMTHNVLNAQVQNIVMNVVPHTIFLTMLVVKQQHTTMEQNVTHVLQVVYLVLEPLLKNVLVAMPDTNLPPVVNVLQIPK